MEVLFTNPFVKDLHKIKDKRLAHDIEQAILFVKSATRISGIKDLKKLKGFRMLTALVLGNTE